MGNLAAAHRNAIDGGVGQPAESAGGLANGGCDYGADGHHQPDGDSVALTGGAHYRAGLSTPA